MTDGLRNAAAAVDILTDAGVIVSETAHDIEYDGDGYMAVDITVKVPVFEAAEYREGSDE